MAEFDFLASLPSIAPELGLTLLAILVLFLDVYLPAARRRDVAWVTVLGLAVLAATPLIWAPPEAGAQLFWGGMVRHDALAQLFKVMILLGGALTALMAIDTREPGRRGEFYLTIVVATLGACLVSSAADLIMLFLGLETLSIPLYILAAFRRDDARSAESGMKYFLFGAFASALMLFGLSLLYGFTGQTSLYALAEALPAAVGDRSLPLLGALTLIVVGLGFKIGVVPFHFWTPDMYEGAPAPVAAWVSVASKAASFALLLRFLLAVFPQEMVVGGQQLQSFWVSLAALMAVLSMTLGNVVALSQRNIKRLLAWSSIAQAGYALIGVAAIQSQTEQGVAAVGFYMFMYTFTNLLAFAVVVFFSEATGSETIADLAGLNRRSPWLALTMTVALLSLGGIPPTAGFFGKFFLFNAAVQADLTWLALVGVLNAIVALYYYLMVIKVMYVDRSPDEERRIPLTRASGWALALPTLAVIALGTVAAQPLFDWALRGSLALMLPGG